MKLHVSLKVEDLQAGTSFYSTLFGQAPSIEKPDYVKWDVQDPPVNFVIEPVDEREPSAGLSHLGVQVGDESELDQLSARIRETGHSFTDVAAATCCYARSDKAWVKGAADEKWEAFLTHSHDEDEYGEDREVLLDQMPQRVG